MTTKPPTLIEEIIKTHNDIFRALQLEWAREWLSIDLTMPQIKVLFFLEGTGELSMSQLAEILCKAQPTVTGLIDRLVEHRFVARRESPIDRRVTLVRLTESGRELVANVTLAREAHTRRLVSRLSEEELSLVLAAFRALNREARALATERVALPEEYRRGEQTTTGGRT